jgi:hypothetical protein
MFVKVDAIFGATTFAIMPLVYGSTTTFSITTLSMMTLNLKGLFATLIIKGTQQNKSTIMLSVFMLSIVMLSVIYIIMLNVIMVSVVMLSVVAPLV